MIPLQTIEWPLPIKGMNNQKPADQLDPLEATDIYNMYFHSPTELRSRGAWTSIATASGGVLELYRCDNPSSPGTTLTLGKIGAGWFKLAPGAERSLPGPTAKDLCLFGVGSRRRIFGLTDTQLWSWNGSTLFAVHPTTGLTTGGTRLMSRFRKLWMVNGTALPCGISMSDAGRADVWDRGGAAFINVNPEEAGKIVDWIEYMGSLYIFKDGHNPRVWRLGGYSRGTWELTGVLDGFLAKEKTLARAADTIFCVSPDGVYAVQSDPDKRLIEANSLSDPIATTVRGMTTPRATYSPAVNGYLLCDQSSASSGAGIWVDNMQASPRTWSRWTAGGVPDAARSFFVDEETYLGTSAGVYRYDPNTAPVQSTSIYYQTSDWDMGLPTTVKNVRWIHGQFQGSGADIVTITIYRDHSLVGTDYAMGTDTGLAITDYVGVNFNCRTLMLKIAFRRAASATRVQFYGLKLGIRSVRTIRGL